MRFVYVRNSGEMANLAAPRQTAVVELNEAARTGSPSRTGARSLEQLAADPCSALWTALKEQK